MKKLTSLFCVGVASYFLSSGVAAQQTTPTQPAKPATPQAGQAPTVQTQPNTQTGTAQAGNMSTIGGISQSPWFNNGTVRRDLNLNQQQIDQMNKAYNSAWARYQQDINGLSNLSDQQRVQQMQKIQQDFYNNLNSSSGITLTNPSQQQRFNQLSLQFRGTGAFQDPTVQQKLNLTDGQRQQLQQNEQAWNQQMIQLQRDFQTDPTTASQRFETLRQQNMQQMNSVLTPAQRSTWQQMTGQSYNFQPNVFFPANQNTQGNTPTK